MGCQDLGGLLPQMFESRIEHSIPSPNEALNNCGKSLGYIGVEGLGFAMPKAQLPTQF